MARRPRQRQEQAAKTIEIKRNFIERSLMDAKEYLKKNRTLAVYSAAGLLGAIVILIAALVAVDHVNTVNDQRFDEIMDRLAKIKGPSEQAAMNVVVADLKKHIDSTYFGFSHNAAYYVLGNIYYDRRNWSESKKCLMTFADSEKKSVFAPIALLKAALSMEEAHDLKGAIELYRRLEDRYADSIVADQLFYNYARVCALNGDRVNARNYYNKVISSFPESGFSQQAKKRLFMLGAN